MYFEHIFKVTFDAKNLNFAFFYFDCDLDVPTQCIQTQFS